jgi:hypothetical protein
VDVWLGLALLLGIAIAAFFGWVSQKATRNNEVSYQGLQADQIVARIKTKT